MTNDGYAGRRELEKGKFSFNRYDLGVIIYLYDDGTIGDRPENREEARRMMEVLRASVPKKSDPTHCQLCGRVRVIPTDPNCHSCGIRNT